MPIGDYCEICQAYRTGEEFSIRCGGCGEWHCSETAPWQIRPCRVQHMDTCDKLAEKRRLQTAREKGR